ncbi:spore germination protein [Bacillus sp. FJAT-47783]|uniref:spore germination protein n=1 Tax=Bacillus sp. FJAT-47783 TaxID=2922712 RepID=UPI001FABCF23|nr:spore germination protein [Bacillus sp. FJAT-47783]
MKFLKGKKKPLFSINNNQPIPSSKDLLKQVKDRNQQTQLYSSLQKNLEEFKKAIGNSTDVTIRPFRIGHARSMKAAVIFTDGLANETFINDFIMEPLMNDDQLKTTPYNLTEIKEQILTMANVEDLCDFDKLYTSVLSGDTVILFDGFNQGFVTDTKSWESRNVAEPQTQTVIRGPHEGFTETLRTNTALIRRKIRDQNLWLESRQIGTRTKTDIAIMYIKGVANDKVVEEIHRRLDQINIDGILESGYIEELIQDKTFTPFPTIFNSERPDTIAGGLLEGRVAIIVDGSPNVLLVPALFVQFLQTAEDYYHRTDFGLIRLLRYIALFISLLAPSLYIAITTFHQEMLQTSLLISIAAQREGIPFPAFIEALMMETTFEILREAGIRMPRAIGPAISIVGALVLGESAVAAGLVSPAMVIVVSITAISGFILPSFSMGIPIRILRFGLMALAASFGLFGIIVGLIAIVLHLCSLRSFGVPYMSPVAPMNLSDQKDTILRFPLWAMRSRPRLISQLDTVREQTPKPEPPKK